MFNRSCSSCTTLRAILSDREETHVERERAWKEEREQLLDRILALSRPDAMRYMGKLAPSEKKSEKVEIFRPAFHKLPSVLPATVEVLEAESVSTEKAPCAGIS